MALRNRKNIGTIEKVKNGVDRLKFWEESQSYPVRVLVIKPDEIEWDWAGRYTYDDHEVYELKSDNTEIKAPSYEHLTRDEQGNKLVIFGSPEKGVYEPLEVDWEDFGFQPGDNSWLEWQVQANRREHENWKEDKGGLLNHPAFPQIAMGMFMFLTLIGFAYFLQSSADAITNAAGSLEQALRAGASAVPKG